MAPMSVTRPSDYEKQLQPENDASTMVRMTLKKNKKVHSILFNICK
jgi:hypothetical protein